MSSVAARPNVEGTVEQVMSGELFSGLLFDDVDQRALALEAVLAKVVDDDTRVLWVFNPLRSPLTIERLLIQIVGPEVDLRLERSSLEIARLIAKPVGQATRLLIVVQQAETISAETLDQLIEVGGHLGGEPIQLQFLFVGSTSFEVPQLASLDFASFPPPRQEAEPPEVGTQPPRRRRDAAPLVLLLTVITVGAIISSVPALQEDVVAASIRPASRAAAPVPDSAPMSPDMVALRREFETFLAQRNPPLPKLTDSEKDALFNGFLTYHRRE